MQLNGCRVFVPAGGEQRGSSAWGGTEHRKMPHLRGVFVRLTNAAFLPPLAAAAGCSVAPVPPPVRELQTHTPQWGGQSRLCILGLRHRNLCLQLLGRDTASAVIFSRDTPRLGSRTVA